MKSKQGVLLNIGASPSSY